MAILKSVYEQLFRAGPDPLLLLDPRAGTILDAGASALEIYRCSDSELLGRRFGDLAAPDLREQDFRAVERAGRGEFVPPYDTVHAATDGQRLEVRIRLAPLKGARGEIEAVAACVQDLTDRRSLEQQLRQAQKMEAIGRLAGGIAHDFNNMLTAILGYCDMLLLESGDPKAVRADAEQVRKAAQRAAQLTRQLLAFSRKQPRAPKVLDPNAILADVEKMLKRLIGENIRLELDCDSSAGRIEADPGQFEQVIMNLAVNARDAMPTGGTLAIRTRPHLVDEEEAFASQCAPGPHLAVEVSDTGVGMDAATLSRLFEPFFTTKPRGEGTGLGLSTVYGIVKQSGGHVAVDSSLGAGTTFRILLPSIMRPESPPTPLAIGAGAVGSETILLVEDDDAVRGLAKRILCGHGYRVVDAKDGDHGLYLAANLRESLRLLVTDVILPKRTGRELAAELLKKRPDLKVLFLSGYTHDVVARQGIAESARLLQKPFTAGSLLSSVRQAIDA